MSQKIDSTTAGIEEQRHLMRFNRALERIETVSELSEDIVIAVLTAHFEKNISVDDVADIFCLQHEIINLIIADAGQWD